MFCPDCGSPMKDTAKFCPNCGSPADKPAYGPIFSVEPDVPADQRTANTDVYNGMGQGMNGDRQISPHITLGADGKYRWIYEYSLFKHPGLFFLIWKIFFFIVLGIFAFMFIISALQGDLDGERALDTLKVFGYFVLGMTALVAISYLIYAAVMGGRYVVIFEMDENGVNHKQIDQQAKKARRIGEAATLIGALAGSRSAMAAGMNTRTEMYTSFRSCGKVKAYKRKNLIKMREALSHNQVFAHPEDFDFVLNYILARIPENARRCV